jgi:rubrerythrin
MVTACALRQAASRHYSELALQMRRHGNESTAEVFERLAAEEKQRSHSSDLRELVIHEHPRQTKIERWARSILGEGTGVDDAHLATPYGALAVAVRDAVRIYSAYVYLAAWAEKPELKTAAERLAEEEFARATHLRVQRRRAYHDGRSEEAVRFWPSSSAVRTLGDLLALASAVERITAERCGAGAVKNAAVYRFCEKTRSLANRLEEDARTTGQPGARIREILRDIEKVGQKKPPQGEAEALRQALADAEQAFAFYDGVVASTNDEAVMQRAQQLTDEALQRVKSLYVQLDLITSQP